MPCVVVKSESVKGGQTTDGGVHYLTKGGYRTQHRMRSL